ncbi:oxaloacetate decarboxylase, partial [Salmonella enterica subsp. enterica serovar Typhimurium str. ST4581]
SDGGDISQLTAAFRRPLPHRFRLPPRQAPDPGHRAAAGNIWKVIATEGQTVAEGDVLLILEAMKMETEIAPRRPGRYAVSR